MEGWIIEVKCRKKKKKNSYFYKATCLVKLVLNLAAFSNFNNLPHKFTLGFENQKDFWYTTYISLDTEKTYITPGLIIREKISYLKKCKMLWWVWKDYGRAERDFYEDTALEWMTASGMFSFSNLVELMDLCSFRVL